MEKQKLMEDQVTETDEEFDWYIKDAIMHGSIDNKIEALYLQNLEILRLLRELKSN